MGSGKPTAVRRPPAASRLTLGSGKPTAASQLRSEDQQRQADSGKSQQPERETVEETVGHEPLRERTLRLNLVGATLFEFELGAWRPAWPKPPSGSHHHPGRAAARVAEANNRATAIAPGARLTRGRGQQS